MRDRRKDIDMTDVYVVMWHDYEYSEVKRIFSKEEDAKRYAEITDCEMQTHSIDAYKFPPEGSDRFFNINIDFNGEITVVNEEIDLDNHCTTEQEYRTVDKSDEPKYAYGQKSSKTFAMKMVTKTKEEAIEKAKTKRKRILKKMLDSGELQNTWEFTR